MSVFDSSVQVFLAPVLPFLKDDSVTEIMINGPANIFIERKGFVEKVDVKFEDEGALVAAVRNISQFVGRPIDEERPFLDARLPDGSRIHAVVPPVAKNGTTVAIRKFSKTKLEMKDLITKGALTVDAARFIDVCLYLKKNIIVSGGTGSGKTTLLNILGGFIPASERIITIEDSAELQLPQDHWGRLETRPANMEGKGEVSIRDLVRNSLRMRPDRIIIGECRAGEALDMLQAMNTGHDGSMTTVHSNTPRDAIARLETLCMMAGMDLPAKAIREQIASAVNLIVQQSRLADGSRKVTSITEVIGMQGDVVTMQEIFTFKRTGMDKDRKVIGKYVATGFIPKFIDDLEQQGIKIPRGIFSVG